MSHFLLWSIISTKNISLEGKLWHKLYLEYPPGHTTLFLLHFYHDQTYYYYHYYYY